MVGAVLYLNIVSPMLIFERESLSFLSLFFAKNPHSYVLSLFNRMWKLNVSRKKIFYLKKNV